MHPFADNIDWKTFDAPSQARPFGLLVVDDGLMLSDPVRERLFKIATELVGPRPFMDDHMKMQGRWTASHNCKSWSFDTEGARAAFVLATKGDVSAL